MQQLKTFIGFAIKSGAIIYGQDNIFKQKNVPLVLIKNGTSDSTINKLKAKFKNVLIIDNFEDFNLKGSVCAILNQDLAKKCIEIICESKGANSIE